MGAATETLEFVGGTGARLQGVLHHPEGDGVGSILLAHCFTCSKDLHTMTRLARGLAEAGYAVLRFDFTGLGESEGGFESTSVSSNVADLTRAAVALIERGFGPCGLLGHSLGGSAALLAAERLKTVRSIVVVGAPSTSATVARLIHPSGEIPLGGKGWAEIGGREFCVSGAFFEDLERHEPLEKARELGRPLLVLHAVDDEYVDVAEGERVFEAARQPKGFLPLVDADHLLSDPRAAEGALEAARDWFDRTL